MAYRPVKGDVLQIVNFGPFYTENGLNIVIADFGARSETPAAAQERAAYGEHMPASRLTKPPRIASG